MYVVTFYSYQGGTGQTTALVNVAYDLAQRGRKVLLVDFNLEKPSLSGFASLRPDGPKPGLVEFIAEYVRLGQAPAVHDYLYGATAFETRGEVWVMPAGRADDNYWLALARIDWQDLYAVRDGFLLLDDLKAQWREDLAPDYVLIDAQAGVRDATAVCTRQLADDVVLFVVPDQSDLSGIKRVMADVYEESVADGPQRIDLHIVTSKVPDLDGEELPGNADLGSLLEPEPAPDELGIMFELTARIPHDPALLLNRQVAARTRPRSRLAAEYRRLANALILGNCTRDREGARAFLKQTQRNPDQVAGVIDESLTEKQRRWFDEAQKFERLVRHFSSKRDAGVLAQAASCLFLAGATQRAIDLLDEALERCPGNRDLLWRRAAYRHKGHDDGFADDLMALLDPLPPRLDSGHRRTSEELMAELRANARERHLESSWLVRSADGWPKLDTRPLSHDVPPLETVSGLDTYLVSALRMLSRLAPKTLELAMKRPEVARLSTEDRARALTPDAPRIEEEVDPRSLIQAGQFCEAVAALEPRVSSSADPHPDDAFHLAMAYWATGNEREAAECSRRVVGFWLGIGTRQFLDLIEPTIADLQLLQMVALSAYRADREDALSDARELVRALLGQLDVPLQGMPSYSYWRYRSVKGDLFYQDCRQLELLIKQKKTNKPLSLPLFLPRSVRGG